LVRITGLEPA